METVFIKRFSFFLKRYCLLYLLLFVSLLLTLQSCSPTEPTATNIELSVSDVSCTEAWIKVSGETGSELILNRDDKEVQRFTLTTSPQTVYDDSLLPNKTYTYQAVQNNKTSSKITAKTLDTTSSNFTWQTFTFGGNAGSCAFYDCAIVNDTLAYAVGEVYLNDSTGQPDPQPYNFAKWNGKEWKLLKVPYYYQGQSYYHPIESVFAFGAHDIWYAGNGVIHWDGNQFKPVPIPSNVWGQDQINKMWGASSSNFYIVGNSGSIAHYTNGNWQKLASGTSLQFLDIYGAMDSETGEPEILAVCNRNYTPGNGLFSLQGNTAKEISLNPIKWDILALWFIPDRHYYIVGSGIYEKTFLSDSLWKGEPLDISRYGKSGIRGNGLNDIFVSGAFGEFLHFNGVRWQSFINELGKFNGSYGGVAVKNNIVLTVGYEGQQAKILMGKRTN